MFGHFTSFQPPCVFSSNQLETLVSPSLYTLLCGFLVYSVLDVMSSFTPAAVSSGRGARVAQNNINQQAQQLQARQAAAAASSSSSGTDDRVWVACNKCDKWRALPSSVDAKTLPDVWLCEYNSYDPTHASCDVPEETYVQPDAQLKVRTHYIVSSSTPLLTER